MKAFDYMLLKQYKNEGYNFVSVDCDDEVYAWSCMPSFDELTGTWRRAGGILCSLIPWIDHPLNSCEAYTIDDLLERVKTSLKTKEGRVQFFADVFELFRDVIKDGDENVYFSVSLLRNGTLSLYDEHGLYYYNKKYGIH